MVRTLKKVAAAFAASRLLALRTGSSAVELMVTAGLMTVVGGTAAAQLHQSQAAWRANSAMRHVMAQLITARELSITQRRRMQMQFLSTNAIRISRTELPGPGTTALSTVPIEGGAEFGLVGGIPDTPEAFGMHAGVDFGPAASVQFNTDGTLVDNTGTPINGTVFLHFKGMPHTFRAVTILGATGRIRGYRWNGRQWVQV